MAATSGSQGLVPVRAVIATTERIPAYGGVRLSKKMLEQLAESLNEDVTGMTLNHDPRRPMRVENVMASVRQRDDGEFEVWAEFDVDELAWRSHEKEKEALGAPGGMSFTMSSPLHVPGEENDDREPLVRVAADAAHFDDALLLAASASSPHYRVQPARLYQFELEPLARVICDLAPGLFASVPVNLLSSYLYDLLQHFVPTKRGEPSILEIRVVERPDVVEKMVYLQTRDKKALRKALDKFGDALQVPDKLVELTPNDDVE